MSDDVRIAQQQHLGCRQCSRICYPSGAPEVIPGFQWGSSYSIFSFLCSVLQIVFFFCPFVLFSLAIALSILRFADFDYSFGIFKLFILIFELQIAENNPIFLHLTSNQLNKFSQNFSLFWIYLKCQVYLRIYRLMMFKSVVIYLDILFCIYKIIDIFKTNLYLYNIVIKIGRAHV